MNISCTKCRHRHPANVSCQQAAVNAIALRPKTCICELCGTETQMTSTRRCDGCWELERRIHHQPELARKILDDFDRGQHG